MRTRRIRSETEPPGSEASLEIAARFLGTRPRSRWEVERRLRSARASDEVIDATLEHLAGLGLVDDQAFSRWWVEQRDRHAPRGRRMVEAELRQHGVGRDVIELMRDELAAIEVDAVESEDGAGELPVTEEARARIALAQHLRGRPLADDPKAIQRLGMFLMRRGFDPETARSAIRAAATANTDGEE
jgi:regulatory protein